MQEPRLPHAITVSLDYTVLDDAALAAVVRSGDREAFRHIVQRFGRHLYRMARSVVNDDMEAEDVVQDAFMRAWRRFDTFRGEASLRSWLTSILLNEARSRLRKRRVIVGLEQITPSSVDAYWDSHMRPESAGMDPASLAAHAQVRQLLKLAIDDMPGLYRMVFVLREIEECSVEETAVQLDINPQTVKTRLYRARRLLRKSLGKALGNMLVETFPFLGVRCASLTAAMMSRLAAEVADESLADASVACPSPPALPTRHASRDQSQATFR